MKIIALFILTAIPCLAMANEPSVFGIELGKPVSLPECTSKTVGTTKMYDLIPDTTCYQEAHKIDTYGTPARRIIFGRKDAPAIVRNWQMIALEAHGDVIGLEFFTEGLETQDVTMSPLTQKYGKPTDTIKRTVQTVLGASFDAVSATWKLSTLTVTYDDAAERIDRGHIFIDLPEAVQMRQDWLKQEDTGRAL
jgi:hypothetical protein